MEAMKIMLVDDEAGMREMLAWVLAEDGFESVVARDGAEAESVLRQGGIDLVITDLTMPRRTGFELLEAMRRMERRPPVIVVTGFGSVEMAVHAMRLGAADFILKPFDLPRLRARIEEVLAGVEFAEASPSRRASPSPVGYPQGTDGGLR